MSEFLPEAGKSRFCKNCKHKDRWGNCLHAKDKKNVIEERILQFGECGADGKLYEDKE